MGEPIGYQRQLRGLCAPAGAPAAHLHRPPGCRLRGTLQDLYPFRLSLI